MDLFACEGEEHAYGGDAGTRALSLSHTCGELRLTPPTRLPTRACDRARARTQTGRRQVDKVEMQSGDDGLALTA